MQLHIKSKPQSFLANRGANGIDGLISTFIGSESKWLILGDLSAMYDLSALWAKDYSDQKWKIVILNNSGGKIFSRIYKSPMFQNVHSYEFSHWAKMFGVKYFKGIEKLTEASECNENLVLELDINEDQSNSFWQSYAKI